MLITFFKVTGESMFPFAKKGAWVLALRPFSLHVGDLVLFPYEGVGMMLKQIMRIEKEGLFVEDKDPMSVDSRVLGLIPRSVVAYKVWKIF
jgi:hypothetical protein